MDELRRALSERLCVLAHDLNNGLGVISGYCELMLEQAEKNSDPEYVKRLQLMLEVVHRLAKRINGHECRVASAQQASVNLITEVNQTADYSNGSRKYDDTAHTPKWTGVPLPRH
ncbi:MAG: hypothetical protein DMG68_06465 [Acidobacteria bacterium]|nr:MAG: hypothetical protein DMG68_06465 [Acidobacteriota bacterium]